MARLRRSSWAGKEASDIGAGTLENIDLAVDRPAAATPARHQLC